MAERQSVQGSWWIWIEAIRTALTSQGILFLVFAAGCAGIFYAKALLSIFSGVIFSVAIVNFFLNRKAFRDLKQYGGFIALMCIVLVYVISGMHSDDTARWAKLTWESIPYATIPLGFFIYRNIPASTWGRLLLIYVIVSTLSAMSLMIDYLLHFEEYNALYKIGKTIPTPIIHVRYSYFMALAACIAFALAYEWITGNGKRVTVRSNANTNANAGGVVTLLVIGIFLTIVVHVLAVRTGLIALYGGITAMIVFMIFRDKRWKLGIAALIAVFLLGIIAYNAFPSIANKIGYVLYDLNKLKEEGALAEYSDNLRITSIRHGLSLLRENLITGVGIGDLKAEMIRMYTERTPNFPEESLFPPISQYVFTLTAFGIAGGLLFFSLLLYPLLRTHFCYVLLAIYAATLFSLIGETTIELHQGKTVFVALVCIAILYSKPVQANG